MTFTLTASSTLFNATPKDGFMNEFTGSACFVETNVPSFRVVNTLTAVQSVSGTCLSAPVGTCMITTLSAVVVSSTQTTVDFFEVSSGYRTNVAGGSTAPSINSKNQLIAGDTVNGVAFACANSAQTLVMITSAQSVTTLSNFGYSNDIPYSVILKTPGRFLVGTSHGLIHEINLSGTIVDSFVLPIPQSDGKTPSSGNLSAVPVYCMSYDNNLLLVGTDIANYLIDWSTKQVLPTQSPQSSTSSSNILFCTGASGETLASHGSSYNDSSTNTIFEVDYTVQPIQTRSRLYMDSTTVINVLALSNNYSRGFSLDNNGKIRIFTVSARSTTTRTVSAPTPNTQARLIFLTDQGAGQCQVLLDTYANLPNTYRVPTGNTIMEMIKIGAGAVAQWDVARYST